MKKIQSHEQVINVLIRKIFSRKIKPGDKLPSERQLAADMHVDRASVRIALKHLELMNVLAIRQGDGVYVRDYMKGASIDFLRMLFLQTEKTDSEWLADPYILDEVWEFWAFFLPEILNIAARRFTPRDIKAMLDIFDEELANLDKKTRLIDLELQSQELVAEVGNNIVVILITNTCRPLRRKMIELFYASLTDEEIKNHIENKKNLLRSFITSTESDASTFIEKYREILNSHRGALRKQMFKDEVKDAGSL